MCRNLEGFSFVQVILWGSDKVTVVTALLQLHHDVQEPRCAAFDTFTESLVVPGQDPSDYRQKTRKLSELSKLHEVSTSIAFMSARRSCGEPLRRTKLLLVILFLDSAHLHT